MSTTPHASAARRRIAAPPPPAPCLRSAQSKRVTAIAVAAIAGVCLVISAAAVLAASGVNMGAFNSLSGLSVGGGMGVAIVSGIVLIATVSWLMTRAIQSCRSTPSQQAVFSFPPCTTEAHYDSTITYFECILDPKPAIAPNQAVYCGNRAYPAAYVSIPSTARGASGHTPFVLAWSPKPGKTTPPKQEECFYELALTTRAPVIVSLDPVVIDKEASPAFMQPGETLAVSNTTLSCSRAGTKFDTHVIRRDDQPPIYHFVPQSADMLSSPRFVFAAVRALRRLFGRHSIEVNNTHPMIVAANGGKNTGAFIAVWELINQLEAGTCVDATLPDSLLELAKHIEGQSWEGSAIEWVNQMWSDLIQDDNTYVVQQSLPEAATCRVLSDTHKQTIAESIPGLVNSRRRAD